ncbi:MAG: hypothetical protein ACJ75B_05470 [Flavisolibacter sp.]
MKHLKISVLFLLLAAGMGARAQSLKDLLYSGKLKNDSNTVIRKTDDLSTKIDTTRKVVPLTEQTKVVADQPKPVADSKVVMDQSKPLPVNTQKVTTTSAAPAVIVGATTAKENLKTNAPIGKIVVADTVLAQGEKTMPATDNVAAVDAPVKTAAPRTNTKIWRDYTDSLTKDLKAGALSSKKIKKGTYFIMVDYELGTDGMVSITNVTTEPGNDMLQAQVKEALESKPLQLAPYIDSSNAPKKVKRRYSFNVTKD